MAKFDVGDKVIIHIPMEIIECEKTRTPSGLCVPPGMFGFNGKVATITEVRNYSGDGNDEYDNTRYCIDIDKGYWVWDNYCLNASEEKEITQMENIMNMNVEPYVPTDKERNYLMTTGKEVSWKYGYNPTDDGLTVMYDEWARQNSWIIDLFKKSPNYVDGKFYIKLPATELERPVNMSDIRDYVWWCKENARTKFAKENQCMIGLHTLRDYLKAKDRVYDIWRHLSSLGNGYTYYGQTVDEVRAEYDRMRERVEDIDYEYWDGYYFTRENMNMIYNIGRIYDAIMSFQNVQYFSEEDVKIVNTYAEKMGLKVRAHNGNKVTKFYGKVCAELGIDKIVDIYTKSWVDQNGNVHERQEDRGYNKYRALFGDAVNPYKYNRDIIISVNPIDFWTMSLGYKWASCMTIDKHNIRGCDNTYSGRFSGGTTSYMLDNVSFIVYVLPSEDEIKSAHEDGCEDELKSKLKRCVFSMGEDKLIQSRVYPDGRDNEDEGLATQLRNIVQKVIADLLEVNNMWVLKKGSSNVSEAYYIGNGALQYNDLDCCSDVSVSYLKRADGSVNHTRIIIGAEPICPNCGNRHSNEEAIECEYCYGEGYTCDRCNRHIRENDDDRITTSDGNTYCCEECAEAEGYRYCEDSDRWECEWYEDDYDGNYYHYSDGAEYTYEDRCYCDSDNAEADGNRYCEDINCYSSEYVETVEGNYFHNTNDLIELDGKWYESAETIEDNGYVLDENGEYVLAA